MLEILLREYRTHRLARFTAWILAFGAVLWVAGRLTHAAGGFNRVPLVRLLGVRAGFWRLLLHSLAAFDSLPFPLAASAAPRGSLYPHWRCSISLILVLVFLGAFIINGQFAAFLVVLRLRDHFDEIEQVNRVVLQEARYGRKIAIRTAGWDSKILRHAVGQLHQKLPRPRYYLHLGTKLALSAEWWAGGKFPRRPHMVERCGVREYRF